MIKNFQASPTESNVFYFEWSTRVYLDFYEEYDFIATVENGYVSFYCEQEYKLGWKLKGTDVLKVFDENKHDILDDIAESRAEAYYDYSR